MDALSTMLRSARAVSGLSLRVVAHETGLSSSFVHRCEQGVDTPSAENIVRLANLFGADADDWCAAAGVIPPGLTRQILALGASGFRGLREKLKEEE